MTCDAQKMRAMLVENKKYTLDEIWDTIITYSTEFEAENKHYFEDLQMICVQIGAEISEEDVEGYEWRW